MRRFFVEKIEQNDGFFTIEGPEAKHIAKVLRMEPGDKIVLMDRGGSRYLAIIETLNPKAVKVFLEKPFLKPPPSPIKIMLCQSLLKSKNMDYLIQKTSELGVHALFPCTSMRTVVRLKKDHHENKMRHWHQIAQSSATQCDRDMPVEIASLSSFEQLMLTWKEKRAFKIILWEEEASQDLKTLLREAAPAEEIIGVIGPEGGFAREEIELAVTTGFVPVSLGNRILRAETAAIAMVTVLQYEWGDLTLKK